MARIRTIKPEFFTSEDIVELSAFARLLYIATWCEADKEGRLAWKPKTMKMRYFPGDSLDIEALCRELTEAGLIRLYGEDLAYIPGFHKHQHVNPRESASTLPAPDDSTPSGPRKVGKNLRLAVFERDGHACVRCGSSDALQADHILPQSCGGPHILENLRTLCRSCNAARPVQGKALDDDLAKDGFSVESLRVKFGIDASIPEVHAQGGREGKEYIYASFDAFYEAYPRKVDRKDAQKAWEKLKPDPELVSRIMAALEVAKKSPEWARDGGKFIPYPSTYLNGERWTDVGLTLVQGAPSDWKQDPRFKGAK